MTSSSSSSVRQQGVRQRFRHPTVVVTAQAILDGSPSVVHVIPRTSTLRGFVSEIVIEPHHNSGLDRPSAAQCQHVRSVSPARLGEAIGNVGPSTLSQLRETLAVIFDIAR